MMGVRLMGKMKEGGGHKGQFLSALFHARRSPSLLLRRRFLFSQRPLNKDLALNQPTNLPKQPKKEKEGDHYSRKYTTTE